MSKLPLGLTENISNDDYHADREYISSSGLKLMLKSPRSFHDQYVLGNKQKFGNQSALDFGTYIHALILEPHLIDSEFAVFPGAIKRGKNWNEFKEDENTKGKIIMSKTQANQAKVLIDNFNEASVVLGEQGKEKEVTLSSFFTEGYAEQTLCGTLDGIKIKVRFDYRKDFDGFGSINDVKTTASYISKISDVEAICEQYEYDLSAALYTDMLAMHTDKKQDFFFTFISKANGEVKIFKASEKMLERGRTKYKLAIKKLKEARKSGIYFEQGIEELG